MGTLGPSAVFADRYKILSVLGVGGMGQVYRAEHLALRREVALKVLAGKTLPDGEARFEREARAIARLNHPACVRILDYGTYYRSRFIAMELIDGPTLAAALASEGRFSTARAVNIAHNVIAALVHAHGHGVLHRDVKPENVMLVTHGVPRTVLIDFGLASLRDETPLTGRGMILGSPSYIAPERLLGRPYDIRADLYSVGVMLYEMLAGFRPFVGRSPEDIMWRALHRPARPLRAIRDDISPSLDSFVRRALAKDPERRFADAEDMLGALGDVPVLEQLAKRVGVTLYDEQATTMTQIEISQPSRWARFWTWFRYGRWRWSGAKL